MLGVGVNTVARWRQRLCLNGIDTLTHDAPGRGRKRNSQPAWESPLRKALLGTQPCGKPWTVRALARSLGWSVTTTARRIKELG
jgi:transposase